MSDHEDSSSDDGVTEVKRDDEIDVVLNDCMREIWLEIETTQYHRNGNHNELIKAAIASMMRAEDDILNPEMHTLPLRVFEEMVECRWNRKHCGDTYEQRHSEAREIYNAARRVERRACKARECSAGIMGKK